MPHLEIKYAADDNDGFKLDFVQEPDTAGVLTVGLLDHGVNVDIPQESITDVLAMIHELVTDTLLQVASQLEKQFNPETVELILPAEDRSMTLTEDAAGDGLYLPADVVETTSS